MVDTVIATKEEAGRSSLSLQEEIDKLLDKASVGELTNEEKARAAKLARLVLRRQGVEA